MSLSFWKSVLNFLETWHIGEHIGVRKEHSGDKKDSNEDLLIEGEEGCVCRMCNWVLLMNMGSSPVPGIIFLICELLSF